MGSPMSVGCGYRKIRQMYMDKTLYAKIIILKGLLINVCILSLCIP